MKLLKALINFIKDFFWFLKESMHFMSYTPIQLVRYGGLWKALVYAMFMNKWRKMTVEEKTQWYINEDRSIEL
jgi:hypothetical protein